jgi:hypothetical protein
VDGSEAHRTGLQALFAVARLRHGWLRHGEAVSR